MHFYVDPRLVPGESEQLVLIDALVLTCGSRRFRKLDIEVGFQLRGSPMRLTKS